MAGKNRTRRNATGPNDWGRWPVIWRVVAPGCGSYDHDMLFLETENEPEARKHLAGLLKVGWPARLERVSCGPLPGDARKSLAKVRAANVQNPDSTMRAIPAFWTKAKAAPKGVVRA